MRVWRLEHGNYRVRVGVDRDDNGFIDETTSQQLLELQRHSAIPLNLPPGVVTIIELEQQERLDPIRTRADLALSNQEGAIRVHNIGSQAADGFRVVIHRDQRIVDSVEIRAIEAPLDLRQRSQAVPFEVQVKAGDEIEVDPENRIPEITENNNRIQID